MFERDVATGIHRVEDANVNWYIVEADEGLTIVDAGVPPSWASLGDALAQLGRAPDDVEALVLTHAHFDHVGFAERARVSFGIPVWVHEDDVPLARKPLQYTHERARSRYLLTRPRALPIILGFLRARAFWPPPVQAVTRYRDGVLPVPGSPRVIRTPGHTIGRLLAAPPRPRGRDRRGCPGDARPVHREDGASDRGSGGDGGQRAGLGIARCACGHGRGDGAARPRRRLARRRGGGCPTCQGRRRGVAPHTPLASRCGVIRGSAVSKRSAGGTSRMMRAIADPWGERRPYGPDAPWPPRVDCHLEDGVSEEDVERWVRSASVLHSNGDALDIAVKDGRVVGVRGRAGDRVNHGRLGPKDLYGWQATNAPDRLTRPLVREDGELVETDWDTAMERIVGRSRELLSRPGGWGSFGFYTSGQLFLEEYYTLGVIGKAGIGTPHMDGNTRLCTATSAAALKASFGTDGQPGSYADVDHCDTIALFGHNVAETQTVLWMRMLDRRRGPDPPRMLVVDPRETPVAREADLHLAPRVGTNQALMNGLVRELIANDRVDRAYVRDHTLGFEELRSTVEPYTPDTVAEICELTASEVVDAARMLGEAQRLLSTVLQGFYQSYQATAASCQVNNIHLLRGMLGRPGAGLYQMNGQPTAQNTRETGADGDLPGMRNWNNERHVGELAELWNVEPATIPHWAPPTHAMQIWRYAEQGSIELLWISATNPAVSLPDLARIRRILAREELMVVAQDMFRTETTELADVVLPAAGWGEKTGTFTNVDRTVHLSEQAVDPPGEARSDLAIFLDFAARMDFRDRDGAPLIGWEDPEAAFDAWKACSRGRPCDYSGLTYDGLRGESGIQWPCTDDAPDGTERLYGDGVFNTDSDYTETYGHDLATGAAFDERDHRAKAPGGRAFLQAAAYEPGPEQPDDEFPLLLTTGRTVYHFHTRTKTGRTPELNAAAPDVWVELSEADATALAIEAGDRVRVRSARGAIEAPARVGDIREGVVFVPFHYGYWDLDERDRRPRAANELTLTSWDPVSKQPAFKVAAVAVTRVESG